MSASLIQNPVTRTESIKSQLSKDSWQWGLGNFFVEKIPFAGRTGYSYAKILADLFVLVIKEGSFHHKERFHVYEFGAGTAFLSKHFLDILSTEYPDIYQKTTVHISDLSSKIIDKLTSISIFYDHYEHITISKQDATCVSFTKNEKPIFAYSSYLLSSFTTKHISFNNQDISELFVKTTIKPNFHQLDTTQYPPTELTPQLIKNIISNNNKTQKQVLAPKLIEAFTEEFQTIAPSDSTLTSSDIQNLQSFITASKFEKGFLNYSPDLFAHVNWITQNLEPGGAYMICDFGLTSDLHQNNPANLTVNFGVTHSYPVCFPHLFSHFKSQNLSFHHTTRPGSQTQEVLLIKGPTNKQITSFFKTHLIQTDDEKINKIIENIIKLAPTSDTYLTDIQKEINKLSAYEQKEYFLLRKVAAQLFLNGYDQEAFEYALKAQEIYGELAIDALLILGWVCQKHGHHENAIACFDYVLDICKNEPNTYASCEISYLAMHDYPKAIQAIKKAIYYSRQNNIWDYTTRLGLSLKKTGKQNEAQNILKWSYENQKLHKETNA
jgi:tetratricopeptide (TPR) repeat protein